MEKYEALKVKNLYNLNETIAKDLFENIEYPWEALPEIGAFIVKLGETLPLEVYDKVGEDVWIAKDAKVFPSAYIHGPAIIGHHAEIRHCAFIRAMPLSARVLLSATPQNLKMLYCLIKYRCRITIMSGIRFWDIRRIWGRVQLLQM